MTNPTLPCGGGLWKAFPAGYPRFCSVPQHPPLRRPWGEVSARAAAPSAAAAVRELNRYFNAAGSAPPFNARSRHVVGRARSHSFSHRCCLAPPPSPITLLSIDSHLPSPFPSTLIMTMAAFASVAPVGVSSFAPASAVSSRRVSSVAVPAISRSSARMTFSSGGPSRGETIDFSDVDVTDAGAQFSGMVFTPDTADAPLSRANVGFSQACQDAVNNQIQVEYTASYAYHAMFAYFNRDTVALPGFAKYFEEQSLEERTHADEFMRYMNKRGGQVVLKPLAVPSMSFNNTDGTSDAVYAMDLHLQLEKFVWAKLEEVAAAANADNDLSLADLIDDYLQEQVEAVKKAADMVAQLKRVGTPHGVWHFDQEVLGGEDAQA